jgi:hypothetical protein
VCKHEEALNARRVKMPNDIMLKELTDMLFAFPWPPEERPEPMGNSFENLERRITPMIGYLWDNQQLLASPEKLHPIWIVSLRMAVLYINMSNGFDGCGRDFMTATLEESSFLAEHQNNTGKNRLERASRLLSRTVVLLRKLGFRSQLIAIGGDAFYFNQCEETLGLLQNLRNA